MFSSDQMARAIAAVTGTAPQPPVRIEPLVGGYSWTTLLVADAAGNEWVVRVAPDGGTMEPYSPAAEAGWIEAAAGSIPAPQVLGVDETGALLGAPFSVQSRTPGSAVRLDEVPDSDRARYRRTFAETLGRLHRAGFSPSTTAPEAVAAEWRRMLDEYRRIALHRHPGLEMGLRWLRSALPPGSGRATLCHGDYRFANILWVGPEEIGGVLDWERAWIGDPMADVAFTRQFSGWCAVEGDAVRAYEEVSGIEVDEDRVAYGLRFERVRAYLSPLRLMRAVHEGRVHDRRLVEIAEAGEAGMWELVAWGTDGALPALRGELPPPDGPDWTASLTDPAVRDHFATYPRPPAVDPSDDADVAAAVRSWADRPLMRRKRPWR